MSRGKMRSRMNTDYGVLGEGSAGKKHLLPKHEDASSNPQHPQENSGLDPCTINFSIVEGAG